MLQEQHTKGLSKVDIPDKNAGTNPEFGNPNDPKTWKGPWVSLTNPQHIAEVVCKINSKQYHQAHSTPFGSSPLATLLGHRGDTQHARELSKGKVSELPIQSMSETIRILHSIAQPTQATSSGIGEIKEEEFIQTFKYVKESTSSSPSRHHIGHYKAILKDTTLIQMHCAVMSLPFQNGFALEFWMHATDILLEKVDGNSRCHCLRILALFKSDFNQAKKIFIGRRLTHKNGGYKHDARDAIWVSPRQTMPQRSVEEGFVP
jgi:hypothetical protein